MKKYYFLAVLIIVSACKDLEKQDVETSKTLEDGRNISIENAEGLKITEFSDFTIIEVKNPWPNAEKPQKYLLAEKNSVVPEDLKYDQKILLPISKLVVTSTTHIPALEELGVYDKLVGFPGLDFISSEKTRERINNGKIKEIGQNESLNTEILIDLNPDVFVGFAINPSARSYETIEKTGIPVIFNGDWTEKTPLGKAEWIKFFGALFNKNEEANNIFQQIKKEYLQSKQLANEASQKPDVIGGSMYQDVWYMPFGNSWQAQFIADANANYLYKDTKGDGSLSLSFESVLEKANEADFWISSGQFETYEQLKDLSPHYDQFKTVRDRNVYSVSLSKGEKGGVLFYELGPQRPDLILKDLIHIFHPQLLPDYELQFYKPLN